MPGNVQAQETVVQKANSTSTVNPKSHGHSNAHSSLSSEYDYIVCGAGTAGSVVAGRLAANPGIHVLLVEAGGTDELEIVRDPNKWVLALGGPLDWAYQTIPNPRLNDRSLFYSMGKGLGGGSSINVSTWSRGHREDWDFMAAESKDSVWNYESVLDLYRKKIEDWTGPSDDQYRGTGGAVHVQPAQRPHPFAQAFLSAAEVVGLPRHPNQNGTLMEAFEGCSLVDETVLNGQRKSIYRSYIDLNSTQANLTVVTGATVTRLILEGDRATGVEIELEGELRTATARMEVVLSQGAVQTPKLLMQSGIGDPEELNRHGIAVRQPLPAVGRNLHDHVSFSCVWEGTDEPLPMAPRSQVVAFWRSNSSLKAPNFYTYAIGIPFPTPENAAWLAPPERGWSLIVGMSPTSRGSVRLSGSNPFDPVRIDANYLADERDLKGLMAGIEVARQIGNAAPLKPFSKREVHPGPLSSDELQQFLRNGLVTFWHQSGTARIGVEPSNSVVDSRLRVHGIRGLRVADASVLPRVTRGNTMAPCVVVGERAAAFLQEAHGHA